MDIENLAGIGLALAAVCAAVVVWRSRSGNGQTFSTQIGDAVHAGHFEVRNGEVHVTCEQGSKSAPLGAANPVHVAERLMAEIQAGAKSPA